MCNSVQRTLTRLCSNSSITSVAAISSWIMHLNAGKALIHTWQFRSLGISCRLYLYLFALLFSVLFTSLKVFIFAAIGIFIVIRKQNYNLKIYYSTREQSRPPSIKWRIFMSRSFNKKFRIFFTVFSYVYDTRTNRNSSSELFVLLQKINFHI